LKYYQFLFKYYHPILAMNVDYSDKLYLLVCPSDNNRTVLNMELWDATTHNLFGVSLKNTGPVVSEALTAHQTPTSRSWEKTQ
jgi:hypothetical protein